MKLIGFEKWNTVSGEIKPEPYEVLNNYAILIRRNIRKSSDGSMWVWEENIFRGKAVESILESSNGASIPVSEARTTLDTNDTTLMGAQADTYEQVLGIDDVMEALADIYTEILEIKESLA